MGPPVWSETPVIGLSPAIEFAAAEFRVREDSGQAVITVLRTPPSDGRVTVDYAASAGTNRWNSVTAGADFLVTSGTLVFAPGETNRTFVVQILDDGLVESDELVQLTLSNPGGGAVLGAGDHSILRIEDNEVPTPITLDPSFHAALAADVDILRVLVQPDGKLLLGGQLSDFGPLPVTIDVVVRLNSNGTRDSTFAPVRSPFPTGSPGTTVVYSLALQPDGKIVIGGVFSTLNGIRRDQVARVNPNGSVDTNFTASVHFNAADSPPSYSYGVKAIVIQRERGWPMQRAGVAVGTPMSFHHQFGFR
jgi:hypothetical protein